MKLWVVAVGRPGQRLAAAIADYEARTRRYWPLEVVEVKEERSASHAGDEQVMAAEAERLLKRVPRDAELVALTRSGEAWSSERLSRELQRRAVDAAPDVAFVIGGAAGLGGAVLRRARLRLQLSTLTLPHDVARLLLMEQLYRAGTIARGEPYHRGRDEV